MRLGMGNIRGVDMMITKDHERKTLTIAAVLTAMLIAMCATIVVASDSDASTTSQPFYSVSNCTVVYGLVIAGILAVATMIAFMVG